MASMFNFVIHSMAVQIFQTMKKQERADVDTPFFLDFANAQPTAEGFRDFTALNGALDAPNNTSDAFIREVSAIRLALESLVAMQADGEAGRVARVRLLLPFCEIINRRLTQFGPRIKPNMKLEPGFPDLLNAIWFQFAKAIDAGRRFARCKQCGKFFEISGGAGRTDKIHCSQRCQIAAWRERRRKAKQLRAEGATLREIAKQLGSDVSAVKGWLQKGD